MGKRYNGKNFNCSRTMRFRNQLLFLVLSILLPALIAAGLAVWYVYSEQQKTQDRNLKEAARAFALLVENELQTREGILLTLSNSPVLAKGDLKEFYSYATKMAPTPETTIILFDKADRQLLNTRRPFGAELPPGRSSNIPALVKRYGPDKTLISDVFFAPWGNASISTFRSRSRMQTAYPISS